MNPLLELLPDVPADLAELSNEALEALLAETRDLVDRLTNRDADTIGEASLAQVIEAATAAVEIVGTLSTEVEARAAAEDEGEEQLRQIREQAALDPAASEEETPETPAEGEENEGAEAGDGEGEETPAEPEAQPAEGEAEGEAEGAGSEAGTQEAIAAAAARVRPRLVTGQNRRPATPRQSDSIEIPVGVVASAEGVGMAIGERVTDWEQIRRGFIAKAQAMRGSFTEGSRVERIPLFKLRSEYPEDRQLHGEDIGGNMAKLNRVTSIEAVTAAGLCAPVTPTYDLAMESIADRPLRDSLPSFNATRGGVIFMAPPKLSAVTTAVGRITNAQAIAGGSGAIKGCQTVACPSPTEVDVASIYACIRSENLNARAFPERLDQFTGLAMAAQARLAENALLDAMVAASTAVTAGQAAGAVADLVKHILTAAAGVRSRHRMGAEVPLRVVMPAWAVDFLLADQVRSQFDRFRTRQDMIAALREANVNLTFHLDSPTTGTSQIYGSQGAGALLDFPAVVQWLIFPEGSFTYLDGGELDLGIVRDSTLNTTNEFTVFSEVWENVFYNGIESLAVSSTLCDTGQTGNTVAIACAS